MASIVTLELPSKWDIIPIHNSDRGNFKRCRQYWEWNSPSRANLSIRADVLGINIPMWYGTGIHYALQSMYSPDLKRDPVEAWKTWFDVQWRGGPVTEDWLDKVYDLKPKKQAAVNGVEVYQIRGLNDILPDPDPLEFEVLLDLGIGMMTYYKDYADRNDGFEVVAAEHDFSVPIWDYENERILTAIDLREESPNYGKKLEVHARGRMDAITVKPNNKYGIADHKTAGRIDEDLDTKLETDEQCTSYLWAAEVEASYYGLPWAGEPMEEVLYNVLRKVYPKPPTILSNGYSFSVDRAKESTTYEMLMAYVNSLPKELWPSGFNEKEQAYVDYLRDVGDEQFIIRKPTRRNRHQIANAGERIYLEALDMLNPDVRIYPNLSNEFKCLNCVFRAPCLAKMDGSDWEQLINDNYVTTMDR